MDRISESEREECHDTYDEEECHDTYDVTQDIKPPEFRRLSINLAPLSGSLPTSHGRSFISQVPHLLQVPDKSRSPFNKRRNSWIPVAR